MTTEELDLKEIVRNFKFEGRFIEAVPYGFGHINDTFAATFELAGGIRRRYILQRINHNIFQNPEQLMENIFGVTSYLRRKILQQGGNPDRESLTIVPTVGAKHYFRSESGDYWRGYVFIEDTVTYQIAQNPENLYHAGKAFGRFQKLLSDYPADTLHETIPDFHNTGKRIDQLTEAICKNSAGRLKEVEKEIEFAQKREDEMQTLIKLYQQGELPLRVTHNDTKLNNVLLDDKTGEGVCVIDLDTVMPGLSLYDFGDAIRSGANSGAEDEKDLLRVNFDMKSFEQFASGFLEEVGKSLTENERKCLALSAKVMTYECGIRFLADYLNGDKYFKVERKEHNLDRCRTQFKLVSDMEKSEEQMEKIITDCLAKLEG